MSSQFENPLGFGLAVLATSLLFLSAVIIPLAGLLLIALVPQPALAYGLRHGKGSALALLLTTGALIYLLGGTEAAIGFFFLALMVVGLLYFSGRGWSIEKVVLGTAAGMLAAVATVLVSLLGSLSRVREVVRHSLKQSMELSLTMYENAGVSGETMEMARERSPEIVDAIVRILPAVALIVLVAVILINLALLSYRFPESRTVFCSIGDPKEWTAPEPVVWCLILAGFALFLPDQFFPIMWGVKTLALNTLLVAALFYFFHGLAIVAYFFHRKRVPLFLRGLGYGVIAIEQMATLGVVGLGLFDLWGDFRGLKNRDLNETEAI